MGKAKILSGGKDGRYSLELNYSLPGQDAERLSLIAKRDKLTLELVAANEALGLRTQEFDEAVFTLNYAIKDWQARMAAGLEPDPPIDPKEPDPLAPKDEEETSTAGLLAAHNTLRASNGLPPLTANGALSAAAQGHANWLANNDQRGHTGAGGSTPQQRITAAGYPAGPGGGTGENAARGQPTVTEVMQDWMGSAGHLSNILEPQFTEMGVGYAYRPSGSSKHYWVVTFGRPPN